MAALTGVRPTLKMGEKYEPEFLDLPVAAGAKIFEGALVVVNNTGRAFQGSTSTGCIAVGRAEGQPGINGVYDNSSGLDDAFKVRVRRGIFRWDNSSGADLLATSDRFAKCYVLDDHTVAKTSSGKSIAGMVIDVDSNGVWVQTGYAGVSP